MVTKMIYPCCATFDRRPSPRPTILAAATLADACPFAEPDRGGGADIATLIFKFLNSNKSIFKTAALAELSFSYSMYAIPLNLPLLEKNYLFFTFISKLWPPFTYLCCTKRTSFNGPNLPNISSNSFFVASNGNPLTNNFVGSISSEYLNFPRCCLSRRTLDIYVGRLRIKRRSNVKHFSTSA